MAHKKLITWAMKSFIKMICDILENKFDCVIIIDGSRGLGKSTLAVTIARKVRKEMKRRGKERGFYGFNMKRDLLYTQKEFIRFLHRRNAIGIGDELIMTVFGRDFYSEDQKNIIKMMNTNRDHENLIIGCVPSFNVIDTQVKGLTKIRLTVVRRGLAIIQTPNHTIYSRDKWDEALNMKIEREWMEKGVGRPQYTRLTTFRGVLRFKKLPELIEKKYQKVKDDKRNIIAQEQMGLDEKKEIDPYENAVKMLIEGRIKNSTVLDGMAYAVGKTPDAFRMRITKLLKAQGKSSSITSYYWEGKNKAQEKRNELTTI